jgi:hypothetical protein
MLGRRDLFALIYNIFIGFAASTAYGAVTGASLWLAGQGQEITRYLEAYFVTFNCALAGGLVVATALTVYKTQHIIPDVIENTFTTRQLSRTTYSEWKKEFYHLRKTITFSSSFALVGIIIYYAAKFPFDGAAEMWLLGWGCLSYATGVYVGRKLFHIAHMLLALERMNVRRDIFSKNELGGISTYVNAVSTLAAVMVYVGVRSSFYGPFEYGSLAGHAVKTIMLVPAVIALPVLALFNYYPRVVVRKLYESSITNSLAALRSEMTGKELSDFERMYYLMEYDRISRDELNYRLRMTLADLPMAATIAVALLSLVLR